MLLATACGSSPELTLQIRLPADKTRLAAVSRVDLTATRNGVVLAHGSFSSTAGTVSLSDVSHGAQTLFALDGFDATGAVIARGRSCAVDFEASGTTAALYFAPTNFFGVTASAPSSTRAAPAAMALDDGTVLLAGGGDTAGAPLATTELFHPGLGTFTANAAVMNHARARAESTPLSAIGLLVTGGVGAGGAVLDSAEIYLQNGAQFLDTAPSLDMPRVDHRAVPLADGRTFVTGGSATDGGAPTAATAFIYVKSDGTFHVTTGPTLVEARRAHAAALAVGVPFVFGGYGADGKTPLASVEAIDPSTGGVARTVAHLVTARAEATATALADGGILLVGGIGPAGALADAEVYNPALPDKATVYTLMVARHHHTATVLADGRVLVAGGTDGAGNALSSVEIFAPGVGFLTERSMTTPRSGHVAIPLCDGTVLMVGGGAGAEIYTGSAS